MRICRFRENRLGVIQGPVVKDVTSVLESLLPPFRYPLPLGDALIDALPQLQTSIAAAAQHAPSIPRDQVAFLSPVANPGKIVAAPVNYKAHLEEATADAELHHQNKSHLRPIREAGLFLKATSSLIGPSQRIAIRHPGRRTDHEIELAVVIGRQANSVSAAEALHYVAGYCIGLDITVRGPEDRSFRKSVDTYTVLGPWLVTSDEIPDPSGLDLSIEINGQLRQKSNTRELILGISELIEFASSFYTLHPGDVLLSGTPEGVGPIASGDIMRAYVEGIGDMKVQVG